MIVNRRMKLFFKVVCWFALIGLPFGLMEGIWADPSTRGVAKRLTDRFGCGLASFFITHCFFCGGYVVLYVFPRNWSVR